MPAGSPTAGVADMDTGYTDTRTHQARLAKHVQQSLQADQSQQQNRADAGKLRAAGDASAKAHDSGRGAASAVEKLQAASERCHAQAPAEAARPARCILPLLPCFLLCFLLVTFVSNHEEFTDRQRHIHSENCMCKAGLSALKT